MIERPSEPIVWTRHYSSDQFRKFERIERARFWLDAETADLSRFSRCQLEDNDKLNFPRSSFDGMWGGKEVKFSLSIRTLETQYAISTYARAIRCARDKFPDFADFSCSDGPLVGQRSFHFHTNSHEMMAPEIYGEFYKDFDKDALFESECFRISEVDAGSKVSAVPEYAIFVALDRSKISDSICREISDIVKDGIPFPVSQEPQQCDPRRAVEMLTDVSLPELVYLNWDHCRKPLSDLDRQLHEAVRRFDPAELATLIDSGADPNCIDEYNETVLSEIVENEPWMYEPPKDQETTDDLKERSLMVTFERKSKCIDVLLERGAHIDLAAPNQVTPLTRAVLCGSPEMVLFLLRRGADDTIRSFDDGHSAQWPTAWDYACSDRELAHDPEERLLMEKIWQALRAERQAPNGLLPGERPNW